MDRCSDATTWKAFVVSQFEGRGYCTRLNLELTAIVRRLRRDRLWIIRAKHGFLDVDTIFVSACIAQHPSLQLGLAWAMTSDIYKLYDSEGRRFNFIPHASPLCTSLTCTNPATSESRLRHTTIFSSVAWDRKYVQYFSAAA